jgi:biotin synthase
MRIASEGKTRACATLGALTPETAKFLFDCGIRRVNHNLETSRRFYPSIVTTQPYSERINTLKTAKAAGLSLCSGGIFGLGENWDDRLDMIFTLREIGVDVMPINFLNPIHGTPLGDLPKLPAMECLKIISICRFLLPQQELKVAGGREVCLRDLQSWIFFAGADSTMIGNYLTTYGRSPEMDHQMVRDLGLNWRAYDGGGVKPSCDDPRIGSVGYSGKYRIPILYEREVATSAPSGM